MNKKGTAKVENSIMNSEKKNLLVDNDRYHAEHKERSNTFQIMKDTNQKQEDELIQLILSIEKKLRRSLLKSGKAELRCIKEKL